MVFLEIASGILHTIQLGSFLQSEEGRRKFNARFVKDPPHTHPTDGHDPKGKGGFDATGPTNIKDEIKLWKISQSSDEPLRTSGL